LKIARKALELGSWATNILNAANEIAVAAYLAGTIGFLEIAGISGDTIERADQQGLNRAPATIKDALALDREGRRIATGLVSRSETKQGRRGFS
jgi:1-deoxy-D-xylulose-5-phosphate reductoisomerase